MIRGQLIGLSGGLLATANVERICRPTASAQSASGASSGQHRGSLTGYTNSRFRALSC